MATDRPSEHLQSVAETGNQYAARLLLLADLEDVQATSSSFWERKWIMFYSFLGKVSKTVDHGAILESCLKQSDLTFGYVFMLVMSIGLATLGLLLNSPTVIIGAMLVSPLMNPIMAIGFAFPNFNIPMLFRGGGTLLVGVILSVITASLLVSLSPMNDLTSEILARTRPNLFDLLVALFSGLVGGYATIRANHAAIVGVAIATALMPPLATVGFGIAIRQAWVAQGAAMLFITNTVAIALGVALVAAWYGFGRIHVRKVVLWHGAIILLIGFSLFVPLFNSLMDIAEETGIKHEVRKTLQSLVENNMSNLMGDYRVDLLPDRSVKVMGIIYVEHVGHELEKLIHQDLEVSLNRKVKVLIKQIPVREMDVLKEKQLPLPGIPIPSAVANPIAQIPSLAGESMPMEPATGQDQN
ncbi:MAG: DUF389 domain-containing protein [Magnetococcales bacterium]|nr:DUF389 domain-containing protein [Magnetococcales bacterium]MBF0151966.1 DUF389 domain-containing protein [Magnetococcales bacterium]MBF0348876.1 DUF389 domain-containing protein [Magnetococcales bacterium]